MHRYIESNQTLIQLELLADCNAHDQDLPDEPEHKIYYRQLLYITHVTLPCTPALQVHEKEVALLGMVHFCEGARGDASIRPVWYKKMGTIQAVNMATIQCGVGCVKMRDKWGILDLSVGCARTAFSGFNKEDSDSEEE